MNKRLHIATLSYTKILYNVFVLIVLTILVLHPNKTFCKEDRVKEQDKNQIYKLIRKQYGDFNFDGKVYFIRKYNTSFTLHKILKQYYGEKQLMSCVFVDAFPEDDCRPCNVRVLVTDWERSSPQDNYSYLGEVLLNNTGSYGKISGNFTYVNIGGSPLIIYEDIQDHTSTDYKYSDTYLISKGIIIDTIQESHAICQDGRYFAHESFVSHAYLSGYNTLFKYNRDSSELTFNKLRNKYTLNDISKINSKIIDKRTYVNSIYGIAKKEYVEQYNFLDDYANYSNEVKYGLTLKNGLIVRVIGAQYELTTDEINCGYVNFDDNNLLNSIRLMKSVNFLDDSEFNILIYDIEEEEKGRLILQTGGFTMNSTYSFDIGKWINSKGYYNIKILSNNEEVFSFNFTILNNGFSY